MQCHVLTAAEAGSIHGGLAPWIVVALLVAVAGSARSDSHGGEFPLTRPPFCTATTPTAIVPMASVTTSGLMAKRWQM